MILANLVWLAQDDLLGFVTDPISWEDTPSPTTCCFDIAHAGGLVDGIPYSNSLEALNASVSDGRMLLEIDLIKTSDGHLVLAHDWNDFDGIAPDLETFLSSKKSYTPLSYAQFLKWRREDCPTCTVITDFKGDFSKALEKFTAQTPKQEREDRFIVQTYAVKDAIEFEKSHPDQRQILTLYRSPFVKRAGIESLRNLKSLFAVTMPLRMLKQTAPLVHEILDRPVLTHGKPADMNKLAVLGKARSQGANGFYRD